MRSPDRTRRRLVGLVVVAFLLGILASPGATAQADEPAADQADVSQFGGFVVSSRGNGLQLTYDSPGLLPTGSPIFQASVPEALATLNSGPVGFGRASFAFPGPLVADLSSALAAGGYETGIPPYPIRSEAFYPSGPTEARSGEQGTEMVAITEHADSRATTSYAGLDLAPVGSIGGMHSAAQSVIEGDQIISRARSVTSDLVLLGGIITIDSVVTDLVATSNGNESASAGGTTVSGVRVLGMPATVDEDGISFDDDPGAAPPPDPAENPVGGPADDLLGGTLDPVQEGTGQAASPLNELLDQLGAAGDDALQQLFEQSGIEVKVLDPIETVDGGTAERTANGLSITMNYDGRNTPVLTDLLALVPSQELPADNLGPVPFSPQALFNLLKDTHITGMAIAPANVSAAGTPSFEFGPSDIDIDVGPTDVPLRGSSGTGTSSPPAGGFETATPELPPSTGAGSVPTSPAGSGRLPFGDAVPALAVLGLVLGSPFFAGGSRRLADNALAAVGTSCPEGLDLPPNQEAP